MVAHRDGRSRDLAVVADLDLDWITDPAERVLTRLLLELRPTMPPTIAWSLTREALDAAADKVLDVEWAAIRMAMYPEATFVAHIAWCRSKACRVRRPRRLGEVA